MLRLCASGRRSLGRCNLFRETVQLQVFVCLLQQIASELLHVPSLRRKRRELRLSVALSEPPISWQTGKHAVSNRQHFKHRLKRRARFVDSPCSPEELPQSRQALEFALVSAVLHSGEIEPERLLVKRC